MDSRTSDLEGFRKAQALAYSCALTVANEMRPDWTEAQTAKLMDTFLRDHGVRSFFHHSFAWFGERAAFRRFKNYFDFLPTDRRLKEDDVVILDTAPLVEGYTGDIGYTFSLKPNSELKKAKELLLHFRDELPKWFSSEQTAAEIWTRVDLEMKEAGYLDCHQEYPFGALGHRVRRLPLWRLAGLVRPFGFQALSQFFFRGFLPEILHSEQRGSKVGVWAVEPHLGKESFGAKFEEILVCDGVKTFWLDESVPQGHQTRESWLNR